MARALRELAPRVAAAAVGALLLAACGAVPVRVERADPTSVQRQVTSNVLNSERPSALSVQLLQRLGLYLRFQEDPVGALRDLHSIIAGDVDGPVADASDGVVRYSSAHIRGVESEKIVRSGHSAQGNPETIEEIRRILLLHLLEE